MLKKQKGFSLIELLLVLSFIGIFVAMTVNFSIHNKDRWALRGDAREITSLYYQAKQRAARENANVLLDIGAKEYTYSRDTSNDNTSAWEIVKHELLNKKVTASHTAKFLINPMGFILADTHPPSYAGIQTITLEAPRGAGKDTMTIIIYPYGGLHVEKVFK